MAWQRHSLVSREDLERLIVEKSSKILQARNLEEAGLADQAREVYVEAARLEEQVASVLRETGQPADFAISLVSAASCWAEAGNTERSRTLFEQAANLDIAKRFREKISRLLETSDKTYEHLDNNIAIRAARILLLLKYCSDAQDYSGVITGLTRLAKLDFFLRYPTHLARAIEVVQTDARLRQSFLSQIPTEDSLAGVSRIMVRHHYGPWDHNYYNVFAYLTAKGLVAVRRERRKYVFCMEPKGHEAVAQIEQSASFQSYVRVAQILGEVFGDFLGTQLKQFIYDHFEEIARAKLGEAIWDH